MKNWLIILNEGPYGTERTYNGLRLAMALQKRSDCQVKLFLMGDAVACAVKGQTTPQGWYNVERMLTSIVRKGAAAT
ncbi:MAG: DsrE family protein [bacterium]|jgi:uncharacterized protein involved in oxidation of intracellular sulfur|nr:DsrE family protein [bacterium]